MNIRIIGYIIGYVLRIEGILMLLPAFVGALYNEKTWLGFFVCAIGTFLIGLLLSFKKPKNQVFYAKEAFVTVPSAWIFLSLFGCFPFIINKEIPKFVDAFFEMVSGFTTTGSSILSDIEALSHAALFWRSFSHWIGGMGVLVFILSILPLTGGGTMHLMRAESPGPQVDKIVPRVRDTSIILYVIYTVMTLLEIVVLVIGEVPLFDAVTLSFGTAGTGGFSIKNSSVADYSAFAQYMIAVFMILFGINFNFYFLLVRRHLFQALRFEEVRWYLLVIVSAVAGVTLCTLPIFDTVEETFRSALFQVSSIITTTGFSTTDFNIFPQFAKMILLLIMFIGACAGSTGGGIKVSRVVVMLKTVRDELSRIIHPRAVKKVRLDGKVIEHSVLRSINTFLLGYIAVFVLSLLLISFDNFSFETNFSGVAATINNIGPGFDLVGPMENFAKFSDFSKLVFCFDMLAGRLEILPILVLFNPKTWSHPFRRTANREDARVKV